MTIDYDIKEKRFKKKYSTITGLIILLTLILGTIFLKEDYFLYFFAFQAFLVFPFFPNLLFLRTINCPNCNKNYFTPFFASKEDIKSLLKSNPKCVNCNYEAEIISEYKHMY